MAQERTGLTWGLALIGAMDLGEQKNNLSTATPKRSLAQTWLTWPEFYRLLLQDITAIPAFSRQVAPPDPVTVSGRGGQAIIPCEWRKSVDTKAYAFPRRKTRSQKLTF